MYIIRRRTNLISFHEKNLRSKQIIRVFVVKFTNFLDADVNSEWSGTTRDRITSSMQNQPNFFCLCGKLELTITFVQLVLNPFSVLPIYPGFGYLIRHYRRELLVALFWKNCVRFLYSIYSKISWFKDAVLREDWTQQKYIIGFRNCSIALKSRQVRTRLPFIFILLFGAFNIFT